ncbi:hypothetical protein AA19596_1137 [Acetobacter fabarum DSM 19596]|nr:hypothetical protein AA19596_1137 [Acetobacter fabarum DSM 19596]
MCPKCAGNLDLVHAQPATGTIDQHGLTRSKPGLRDKSPHGGANGAGGKGRLLEAHIIRYANGRYRRQADILGISTFCIHGGEGDRAAQVLPPSQAVAALAAKAALIACYAVPDLKSADCGTGGHNTPCDLMAKNNPLGGTCQFACPVQQVMVADSGSFHLHKHIMRACYGG